MRLPNTLQCIQPLLWALSGVLIFGSSSWAAPPTSKSKEASDFKNALQPYIAQHAFAGAVTLVVSKEKVVSLETVGYADLKTGKRMRSDTLFWIASMGKPIAATALMMLVDEGKVRLDDPVSKYLPTFRPPEMVLSSDKDHIQLKQPTTSITLRDLLSHVSGVRYSSSFETRILDRDPLPLRVESYALEPLLFEPRTDFSYSDAGINTISRVIEVVVGVDYTDFVQQRLFTPLGMRDTTFWPTPAQVARLAKSYTDNDDGTDLEEVPIEELHYPLTDRVTRFPTAAGGLFSTASDLAQFCRMLLNGGALDGRRYITEASLKEMTRNQLPEKARERLTPNGYGLGWYTTTSGAFAHGGAYHTNMRVDPAQGIATIWLIQYAGGTLRSSAARETFERLAVKWYGLHPGLGQSNSLVGKAH